MKNLLLFVLLLSILMATHGAAEPSRGEWHDGVFISEAFGLNFTPPDGWYSEPDDRALMVAQGPAHDEWFREAVWLSVMESNMTIEEYFAGVLAGNVAEVAGDEPLRVLQIQDHTTRIGRYDWNSYSYWGIDGGIVHVFVRAVDGFRQEISIFCGRETESLEEILAMFSPLE